MIAAWNFRSRENCKKSCHRQKWPKIFSYLSRKSKVSKVNGKNDFHLPTLCELNNVSSKV